MGSGHGYSGVGGHGVGVQHGQCPLQRVVLAGPRQVRRPAGQQIGQEPGVANALSVCKRLSGPPLLRPPERCAPVHLGRQVRSVTAQVRDELGAQQLGDPVLGSRRARTGDQASTPHQLVEHVGRVFAVGEFDGQTPRKGPGDADTAQGLPLRGLEAGEHLVDEVVRDRALVPRELGQEAVRIGVRVQRHGRQPQPGDPAARPHLQQRDLRRRQPQPQQLHQRRRLLVGEQQLLVAHLVEPLLHPQPGQRQGRVTPAREHEPETARGAAHEHLETMAYRGALQVLDVVQHQAHPLRQGREALQQLAEEVQLDRLARHNESAQTAVGRHGRERRQGGEHRAPHPSGVGVLGFEAYPRCRRVGGRTDPGGQQGCLSRPGRGAHERQVPVGAAVEGGLERAPPEVRPRHRRRCRPRGWDVEHGPSRLEGPWIPSVTVEGDDGGSHRTFADSGAAIDGRRWAIDDTR